MFEDVIIEQEQIEIFSTLVEAHRNVPRHQRQNFWASGNDETSLLTIRHPGLLGGEIEILETDLDYLGHLHFVSSIPQRTVFSFSFNILPRGFEYYEFIKKHAAQPIQQIETTIRTYLDSKHFREAYSQAYQKWKDAEAMLWGSDSERQLSMIGHLCREAIQEFATALVDKYHPPEVETNKAQDKKRLSAVLQYHSEQLGGAEEELLKALLGYWVKVSELTQRQEHGGQREGRPLIWEDGRRVVFQTAIVMFEVDTSLSRKY